MESTNRWSGRAVRMGMALALVATFVAAFAAAPATAQDIETQGQFLHAAPDLGEVEVHLNGEGVLDNFGYGTVSDWIDLDPGVMRVTLTLDRAGFNYIVFDSAYPIAAGTDYNFVITDALVMVTPITQDPLPEGRARVQLVHGSVDTPAIDVAITGGDVLASDLGFSQRSDEVQVPAGTYDLEIRLAGSTEPIATLPGTMVEAGMVYEFVVMGDPNSEDKPVTVTALVDAVEAGEPVATPAATPSS